MKLTETAFFEDDDPMARHDGPRIHNEMFHPLFKSFNLGNKHGDSCIERGDIGVVLSSERTNVRLILHRALFEFVDVHFELS